jgi:hypothetical protein
MANTDKQFKEYKDNLVIPSSKRTKMNDARDRTREKIQGWFKKHHPDYPISFWIQGSHKNALNIRTENDECDQDDGLYVNRNPVNSVDGTTLQKWIIDALAGSTSTAPEHKNRCVRNIYKPTNLGSFHIDYPSYYQTDQMKYPMLTVKDSGLEKSDPQEFIQWLSTKTDDKGQVRRIIRCLKGWASFQSINHQMPNGLSLTILACNDFVSMDARDDESLYKTLIKIQSVLQGKWQCIMPTAPGDDLFAGYDYTFKSNFMAALQNLIDDGRQALNHESKHEASVLWKKHLGSRFPLAPKEVKVGSRESLSALVGDNKPYFN